MVRRLIAGDEDAFRNLLAAHHTKARCGNPSGCSASRPPSRRPPMSRPSCCAASRAARATDPAQPGVLRLPRPLTLSALGPVSRNTRKSSCRRDHCCMSPRETQGPRGVDTTRRNIANGDGSEGQAGSSPLQWSERLCSGKLPACHFLVPGEFVIGSERVPPSASMGPPNQAERFFAREAPRALRRAPSTRRPGRSLRSGLHL